MKEEEIYSPIQLALREGKLSKALDLLLKLVDGRDEKLKEDALLLKSKFEYNRNQYEVKGVLTEKEFNIQYSKTVVGIQHILESLQTGKGAPQKNNIALSTKPTKNYRRSLLAVFVIVVLGISGYWYASLPANTSQENTVDSQTEEVLNPVDRNTNPGNKQPNHTPIEEPSEEKTKKQPEKQIEKPTTPVQNSSTQTTPAPENEMREPVEPPSAKTFTVNIIRNSNMSDAKIFVDGEPATILNNTSIIITIKVAQKPTNHIFELRTDDKACQKELLITADDQKVIFSNCN